MLWQQMFHPFIPSLEKYVDGFMMGWTFNKGPYLERQTAQSLQLSWSVKTSNKKDGLEKAMTYSQLDELDPSEAHLALDWDTA